VKKIKKSKNKKHFALTFILLTTIITTVFSIFVSEGQVEVPTYPYLVVTPNPVGVGQKVSIIMWIHGAPPTASGIGGQRYNFTLEVKKPNENNFNFVYPDSNNLENKFYISDETGSTFTQYTPTVAGEYTFILTYVGQIITRFNPETGLIGIPEPLGNPSLINSKFLPSETTKKLTVQQEPIPDPTTTYPLPEEYWTHPIEGQNTGWADISSNWLAGAHIGQNYGLANTETRDLFQRDGTAPDSPHIMWTKPIEFGGVVGGTTEIPGIGFYSGGSYEPRLTNAICMFGRLYYQVPLYHAGGSGSSASAYTCVDLRTGETIWISDEIGIPYKGVYGTGQGPTIKGQLYDYETVNQHGVVGGLIWVEYKHLEGFVERYSDWMAYDAFTGQWVYNLTNVPVGTEVYTKTGEIERYVLDFQNGNLSLWTSSAIPNSPIVGEADMSVNPLVAGTTFGAFEYRPMGKNADMSNNFKWSVPIPALPGDGNPTIIKVLPDDLILGTSTAFPIMGLNGISRIPPSAITMWALNLDVNRDANEDGVADKNDVGALLWICDIPCAEDPENPGNYLTRTLGPVYVGLDKDGADTIRIFTMSDAQNFAWFGYNLDNPVNSITGQPEPIWGPVYDDYYLSDYQYYGSNGGAGQIGYVAYGRLYVDGYGGEIQCFDLEDGSLLWKYFTSEMKDLKEQVLLCETNTVWGYFPTFIAGIADDKLYVFNNEHSPNNPYYKGERVRCLNAKYDPNDPNDRLEIWNLMGMAGQTLYGSTSVIADGFLSYYNYYDNSVYCLGKAATEITVRAPDIEVPRKSSVLIQGSIIDLAPGTIQDEQVKRFPHGVPAVSDDCMGPWMEYVYMQKPYPDKVAGVEINLTVVDPNNDFYQIGTVISEPSGVYGFDFTPTVSGLYKVIATFQGSDSYWPSSAETFLLIEGKTKDTKQASVESYTDGDFSLMIELLGAITVGGILLAIIYKKRIH
jgi:hypothetical protein